MAASETPESTAASALDVLKSSAVNVTTYFVPSPKDLLMVMPRIAAKAGSFVTDSIPNAFENLLGGGITGRAIAEATGERVGDMASAAGAVGATAASVAAAIPTEAATQNGSIIQASFQQIKSFGGILTYMTSKWALGCFTVAIVLNRTAIYASSRRHLQLNWQLRFALRVIPIIILASLGRSLLRSLRCQTSPEYSFMRYGSTEKHYALDFAEDGGFLHRLSSNLLFWESERDSCLAVNMIPSEENSDQAGGSLSLLWPAFQSFAFAQFVETLSCAVEGHPVATETGMSLFEHSLAFAEAESVVTSQIGFPFLGSPSANFTKIVNGKRGAADPGTLPLKNFILTKFNAPPEVLLMALISTSNNLSSQILAVFGLQTKFRLLNTAVWGLSFMGSFIWAFYSFPLWQSLEAGILRFPTVCVVGFIPHILILFGIVLCGCIYSLALVLAVLSPPPGVPRGATWREQFKLAHENMQANLQLSGIRLNMNEDFYTALLRIGFTALTAASEAVFLNEGRRINIGQWTWLEEERMDDIVRAKASMRVSNNIFNNPDKVTSGVSFVATEDDSSALLGRPRWKSGYLKERTTKILKAKPSVQGRSPVGSGASQSGGRYLLSLGYLARIFWLAVGWLALCLLKVMDRCGIRRRPAWLTRLLTATKSDTADDKTGKMPHPKELEFWLLSESGELSLPKDNDVDVEYETRKRIQASAGAWGAEQQKQLDSTLYSWFMHGGWWGDRDSSSNYEPLEEGDEDDDDNDATSVVSDAPAALESSSSGWESEASSGRRTPTQRSPHPSRSREATPTNDVTIDTSTLIRLLNPQDPEQRAEARMLAAHLQAPHIITRSQYRRSTESSNTHILTSSRYRPPGFKASSPDGMLNPMEEAEVLEYLIVRFRERGRINSSAAGGDWQDGADGLGTGGPMCVVCQSSPRTILAWPCRCLSLCEECRVSLAMNNFGTCVCCRQEVVGFSRLFVP